MYEEIYHAWGSLLKYIEIKDITTKPRVAHDKMECLQIMLKALSSMEIVGKFVENKELQEKIN